MQPQNRFKNPPRPNVTRWPGKTYFIILFTTISLLVAFTISFFVILAVQGNNDLPDDKDNEGEVVNNVTKTGAKTGIKLPSSTTEGSFLSSSSGSAESITGISSEAAILVELGQNVSVAEKNADAVIHPASLTKVMTLLVACENAKDPNKKLTVKQEMLDRRTELEGSGELVDNTTVIDGNEDAVQIQIVGKSVTVEDALHLINYQSDTVACLLIAEYVAGSEEAFVEMMNAKASDIGLKSTKFVNCTGLTEKSGAHNKTTARELAAIMACALNNSVAKQIITGKDKYTVNIYEGNKKTEYTVPFFSDWYSRSTRLNNDPWAGDVKIQGGKTGYEDIPRSCFVTYGVHSESGKKYVCVTVGRLLSEEKSSELNNKTSTEDMRAVYADYAE